MLFAQIFPLRLSLYKCSPSFFSGTLSLYLHSKPIYISQSHFSSLSPSSLSSATFTVTLQTCTLSHSLFLSLYLQPRSPIYSLLLWTSPVSFCFYLYLSLYFMRTQPIIICHTSLTTVQYISKISQK